MNTEIIQKRLDEMVGKTFSYGNQIHYILSAKIDEFNNKVIIKTNIKEYDRSLEAIKEFLSHWKEANSVQSLVPISGDQELVLHNQDEQSQADKLIKLLEDNITKVQNDKTYIPQASAINSNINSIIEIQKMKLTFMKKAKNK